MTSREPDPLAVVLIDALKAIKATQRTVDFGALTESRFEALHQLHHHGPMRMGELADVLGIVPRSVTGLVDALEADGFLERLADPEDRRAHVLQLTTAGRQQVATVRRRRIAAIERFTAHLDRAERDQLSILLRRLLDGG